MPRQWEYSALESFYQDDAYDLQYVLYHVNGTMVNSICDEDDRDKYNDLLSQYVALLGLNGWEAISVVVGEEGEETWHFKRAILSSNQYLDFS